MFRPSEQEFTWQSSGHHAARRSGPTATRAPHLVPAPSQGQSLRKGVTIDCARGEGADRTGMSGDQWWLRIYVVPPRATRMRDALILRPPSR
eukprot:5944084-Pyramimonas_sp.AAC.1